MIKKLIVVNIEFSQQDAEAEIEAKAEAESD